jgi:hypothetical protein
MRKLILCGFAALFLVGCYSAEDAAKIERREARNAANKERTNIVERIDGANEAYIGKFEAEFSDGTRVGCIRSGYDEHVACVPLKGEL